MEVYIGPPRARPDALLSRDEVLTALARAGLTVSDVAEAPGPHEKETWLTFSFQDTEVRLELQATEAGLTFATLQHSMFDDSTLPDRICGVLEALGWEIDNENIG
jgi:hypothetical protein